MLPQTVAFIATAAAIYSLGHGLRTFTAVPRSTQRGTPSSVPAQTSNCCNPTEDSGLSWPVCVVDIGRSYSQRGVVVSVPGASQSLRRCYYTAVTSNCCNPTEDRRLSGPVCCCRYRPVVLTARRGRVRPRRVGVTAAVLLRYSWARRRRCRRSIRRFMTVRSTISATDYSCCITTPISSTLPGAYSTSHPARSVRENIVLL